jgi:hypothetical protein
MAHPSIAKLWASARDDCFEFISRRSEPRQLLCIRAPAALVHLGNCSCVALPSYIPVGRLHVKSVPDGATPSSPLALRGRGRPAGYPYPAGDRPDPSGRPSGSVALCLRDSAHQKGVTSTATERNVEINSWRKSTVSPFALYVSSGNRNRGTSLNYSTAKRYTSGMY